MIKMKNIISFFVSIIIILVVVLNLDTIISVIKDVIYSNREVFIPEANMYEKDYDFMYFKESDDFIPSNYDDLVSIFYTTLDKGWNEFTFYCDTEYEECLEDVAVISNDQKFLAEINNFVHPYNSYSTIKTLYDDTGKVTITIDKLYKDDEVDKIDKEIKIWMNEYIRDNMSTIDKIKVMHDAIINKTKYDQVRADTNNSKYDSARIQGVLYDHYAICSGYTDTMAVILSKLNIPNFKIASEEHVWNAVYVDGKWYHLDLTWDDPITTSGRNVLLHDYFLINDNDLTKLDMSATKREHIYNRDIYLEFN